MSLVDFSNKVPTVKLYTKKIKVLRELHYNLYLIISDTLTQTETDSDRYTYRQKYTHTLIERQPPRCSHT